MPEHAHPLVLRLYEEMNRQQMGILDVAERAGLSKNSLKDWRTRHNPRLDLIVAAFGALGMELHARPVKEAPDG